MDCEACTAGIQAAIHHLVADETIETIITSMTPTLCGENSDCHKATVALLRDGLPILASAADPSQFPMVCDAAVEGTCAARRSNRIL